MKTLVAEIAGGGVRFMGRGPRRVYEISITDGEALAVILFFHFRESWLKKKYPIITDVRGRGLLLAIEFKSEVGQEVLNGCLAKGLLVNRVKPNAIRLIPPLIISEKEADRAIDILDAVFSGIIR